MSPSDDVNDAATSHLGRGPVRRCLDNQKQFACVLAVPVAVGRAAGQDELPLSQHGPRPLVAGLQEEDHNDVKRQLRVHNQQAFISR